MVEQKGRDGKLPGTGAAPIGRREAVIAKMRLRCVEHHGQKCTVLGGPVVVRVCALC